jgi:hypothetical protein
MHARARSRRTLLALATVVTVGALLSALPLGGHADSGPPSGTVTVDGHLPNYAMANDDFWDKTTRTTADPGRRGAPTWCPTP